MEKKPFLTEAMAQEIIQDVPTPFHVYDEKGIRENARRINKAFSWNKGFKEYFAVKALPNPVILQILKEEGCGVDCSSLTELITLIGEPRTGLLDHANLLGHVDHRALTGNAFTVEHVEFGGLERRLRQ